jgi:hypothetical protein
MKHRLFATLLLAGALGLGTVQAAELEGVKMPDTLELSGQKLVLNGIGLRTRFIVKVYVAGLYLPSHADTPAAILAMKGAKRVNAVLLREVNSGDLGSLLIKGIRENASKEEIQRIGFNLVKMGEIFGSIPTLKRGDSFGLDWVPGKGSFVLINGKVVTEALPGEEFYNAMLKIWLGEKPADSSLKEAFLGVKKEAPSQPKRGDI